MLKTPLSDYGILDTLPEPEFDDLVQVAAHVCDVPIALLSLRDGERQWFKAKQGLALSEIPNSESFCRHFSEQVEFLLVPDARLDERFAGSSFVCGAPHILFYAGAPIINSENVLLGTLCVLDYIPRSLTPLQIDSLLALSRQAAALLGMRRQAGEMRQAREMTRAFLHSSSDGFLLVGEDGDIRDANQAYCRLVGYTHDEILQMSIFERDAAFSPEEIAADLQRMRQNRSGFHEVRHKTKDGRIISLELSVNYLDDIGGGQGGFCAFYRDITERKLLQKEQERRIGHTETLLAEAVDQADRDPLTGLFNHRSFQKHLKEEAVRAKRTGNSLAIAMLDLNNFKFFNDAYGHLAGDDVLRQVADGLRHHCRVTDIVARFGGDEFAVLMPALASSEVEAMTKRLASCLDGLDFCPPGHDVAIPLGLSLGVAVFPEETSSHLEAVDLADTRLRLAKSGAGETALASARLRERLTGKVEGFSMLDALVTAVDTKDRYTRRHSEDVLTYSVQIAQQLGLDEDMQHIVEVAALLHDVGKIAVPDAVLRKPGKLTDDEFAAIQQHPMMGAIIVGAIPGFEQTLDAVRHHHERWDGMGYPFGLTREECPLIARLMAVADAFSAMTTDRPYRKGMSAEKAQAILQEGAGSQWDPMCVTAFVSVRQQTT